MYIVDTIIYTMLTPEENSFGNFHDWDAVRCHDATPHTAKPIVTQRNLHSSRSDSSKVRMSRSPAVPGTVLMICRFCSPKKSTLTWVHCPCEPVHPSTFIILIPQVHPFCTHRKLPPRAKLAWLDSIPDRTYRLQCPEFESLLTKIATYFSDATILLLKLSHIPMLRRLLFHLQSVQNREERTN